MAPIKLYYAIASPVARSTLFTIEALDLDVEKIEVDLLGREHMSPDYIKRNPLHTVPTLDDGGFTIFDSHAIHAYLVGKYGKDDSLYPKDLQKRAVVDQRLHFNNGVMFSRGSSIVVSLFRGAKYIEKDKADMLREAYKSLEILLDENDYVAGNNLSIADFSLAASVSNANVLVPIDQDAFPKITAWLNRMELLPYLKTNKFGVEKFRGWVQHLTG